MNTTKTHFFQHDIHEHLHKFHNKLIINANDSFFIPFFINQHIHSSYV